MKRIYFNCVPRSFFWFLTASLILLSNVIGYTQVPADSITIVELKNGNVFSGKIVQQDLTGIEIETVNGVLKFSMIEIKSIKKVPLSQVVNGEFWPENLHASRHFWGPSGYGLRKGEGYYQNIGIMANQVSYGFTNNFTMGLGILPIFLLGVEGGITPIWLTPKFSFPYKNQKGSIGVGAIYASTFNALDEGFGILYGVNTFGTRDRQITLGIGYGYSAEFGFGSAPTISISGMYRTSRKWLLLTENYYINTGSEGFGMISFGGRYLGRRLAVDAGGFIPVNLFFDRPIMLPWLGIAIPFK